jgi:type II secretory pathway pseudopilin PulG
MVVIGGVLAVLLSIFLPYLLKAREASRRAQCAENLRAIREALNCYAQANNGAFPRVRYDVENKPSGYVAYTGPESPDPFAANSAVRPNDVTGSLWLLLRLKYVASSAFVCPSSDAEPDARDRAQTRGNFAGARNLSYSYCLPFSLAKGFRLNDQVARFVLAADRNPGTGGGSDVTRPSADSGPFELAMANSNNHAKVGQNVLYATGQVEWKTTPFCGVENDNIYTALSAQPFDSRPTRLDGRGVCGPQYSPAHARDSYLVPTDDDVDASSFPLPPATGPTTTAPTTGPATWPVRPTTWPLVPPTTTTVPATTTTAPTTNP